MPNTYAQKMIEMMNRTGKPMTTTTTGKTTVTTPKQTEGLDLSSLMLMLMMNSMFNPKKPSTTLGTTPVPASSLGGDALRNIVSSAPTSYETNPLMTSSMSTGMGGMGGMDLQKLIQLLASLNPGGTNRAGYGPFTT